MHIVYKHTCRDNGKAYIGITPKKVNDIPLDDDRSANRLMNKRWRGHIANVKKGKMFAFSCAIRSHGADSFDHEILTVCSTLDEVLEQEQRLIIEHNTLTSGWGYNMTKGGDCVLLSDDQKDRHRQATKSAMGRDDVRKKLESYFNDPQTTEQQKRRATESWKNDITRQKHKESKHRQFIRGVGCKHVSQYDKDTNVLIATFVSVRQASREVNIPRATLRAHLDGKLKHAGGFVWRYAQVTNS